MNRLLIFITALSCAGFPVAMAEEYWIAYEGNDFPENEGWTREYGDEHGPDHGGAVRWIEDGCLVSDSMYNPLVYDYSAMYRPISPDPGELFVAQWRLRVDEVSAFYDEGVAVFSDDGWGVSFQFWPTHVVSNYEDVTIFPFTLGEFHSFEFESWDMRTFELRMDNEFTWNGEFRFVWADPEVNWGDGVQGAASIARWDYFEFGVVPEPRGALVLGCVGLAVVRKRLGTKQAKGT
jgi:hypothetical protein